MSDLNLRLFEAQLNFIVNSLSISGGGEGEITRQGNIISFPNKRLHVC